MRASLIVLAAWLTLSPLGSQAADTPAPADTDRTAEIEAITKEVEALRKRIAALQPPRKPPVVEDRPIVVTRPQVKNVEIPLQFAGKVLANQHIDIRSLSNGQIIEVLVKEGQAVRKGQVLFRVDPILARSKLDAELAEVRIAQIKLEHTKKLYDQKVISVNEVALQSAEFEKAKAKEKLAEIEVRFTTVEAPFDGLIGGIRESAGSLVRVGDVLTTLSDNRTMWVYFNVPESRYLEYKADPAAFKEASALELVLANGRRFPQSGRLGAIDGQFNSETGAIAFRADFPNPDLLLRHGQSGTVVMRRLVKDAIVIPQSAAIEDHGKLYVYLVGKDDQVHRQEIVVTGDTGGDYVVGKGLGANDKIVVEGVRPFRDGERLEYEFRPE